MPGSLFKKVSCLRIATFLRKRLWHRCFPVNFAKFLRTTFFIEHLWLLLLYHSGLLFRSQAATFSWSVFDFAPLPFDSIIFCLKFLCIINLQRFVIPLAKIFCVPLQKLFFIYFLLKKL